MGWTARGFAEGSRGLWPFQDGTLLVEKGEFSFPYLPFLSILPAWAPALPQYKGQPVEPVRPLPGLGGKLTIGLGEKGGTFTPFAAKILEQTPCSGVLELSATEATLRLNLATGLGEKGVQFELHNPAGTLPKLGLSISGSSHRLIWAKPHRKDRHDWGTPRWEWVEASRCLLQTYSNPVDASHSMTTGLWFGEGARITADITVDPQGIDPPRIDLWIDPGQSGSLRFGFLHADSQPSFNASVSLPREGVESWKSWAEESRQAAARAVQTRASAELRLEDPDAQTLNDGLIRIRQLFLSNGMILQSPLLPGHFPYSLKDQSIALSYWRKLGLDYPDAPRWRDLVTDNPAMERTIPIHPFRKDGLRDLMRSGGILVAAPDPSDPPTKEEFDVLLGYIIDGGRVTLVDGFSGFEGKTGWWTDAGAVDPADYALRLLSVPVDYSSRRRLDEEGLSPRRNVYSLGMTRLDSTRNPEGRSAITTPKGGFLFVCAEDEDDRKGVRLVGGSIGGRLFQALTASEDEILSASSQPETAWDQTGGPAGRLLRGESFVLYQLPENGTTECEFQCEGEAAFYWTAERPMTEHTLLKKVVQSWYHRVLLTLPVPRAAHPVVYSGTYTCRVFDVTGTEVSPILFHQLGRGSFAWVGLPVESIRLGSDRGTDAQHSLRNDPGYDLIRMTLALHDNRQAGGQQAGATPRFGWTDRLNVRGDFPPAPDGMIHAWESIRQMGAGAGNRTFWGWVFTHFTNALRSPGWNWERMENSPLFAVPDGDRWKIDLYQLAAVHALYRDIEGSAGNLDRTWQNENAKRKADGIEREAIECLRLNSEDPLLARWVVEGTYESAAPFESSFDNALLAVSLFEGSRFPGGEPIRGRIVNRLLQSVPAQIPLQSSALLAVLDKGQRTQRLEEIFSAQPLAEGRESNPSLLAPALYALILDRSIPKSD